MPVTNYEQNTGTPEQVNPAEEISDANVQHIEFWQTESSLQPLNVTVQNVEPLDLSKLRMYWWWKKIPAIDQQDVVNGINNLEEPFNRDVTNLVKAGDVRWLQTYLNSKIDSGDIDGAKLKQALKLKWIWLNSHNHIRVDGKFWPQTLEALKFLIENNPEEPKKPKKPTKPIEGGGQKEEKETWDGSWIYNEMSEQMGKLSDRDRNKDWSKERNGSWDNFKVDADASTIMINTWEVAEGKNTCEINWKTWTINIMCWQYTYQAPFKLKPLALDSNGFPSETNNANRETVRAFTAIWNLMNKLKNIAVFHWEWAIEYQIGRTGGNVVWNVIWGWMASMLTGIPWTGTAVAGGIIAWLWSTWIHLNDWKIGWATDTLLVLDSSWKEVGKLCKQNFLQKDMQIKIASMLTAMKLDQKKIKWDPDVVDSRWLYTDPLDKTHQDLVKQYSKTI